MDNKPAVVQSDGTILLEVQNPGFEKARDSLMRFSDLVKSPEYIHTYKLSSLSLWNARSCGLSAEDVIDGLHAFSRYPVPQNIEFHIKDTMAKYGILKLVKRKGRLVLMSTDPYVSKEIASSDKTSHLIVKSPAESEFFVDETKRGALKEALIKMGYPCEDQAGYEKGDPMHFNLRSVTRKGSPFSLRPYQRAARDSFWAAGSAQGGSGVVVLPCGAGKTIIGIGVMERASTKTLILTTNIVAVRQWIEEILDKTDLAPEMVKEYTGDKKAIGPVTVSTYQMLTYKSKNSEAPYPHFSLFNQNNWGLIIYDEVHLLPAPVFRITSGLQSKRRLGLTATLVREDGHEEEVFTLIGPKKFDKPWKELEEQNWIAEADCHEIRVDLSPGERLNYATSPEREKYRVAATNPAKFRVIEKLLKRHAGDRILIIGQYLDQLRFIADRLKTPLLYGKTPNSEREDLYFRFKGGDLKVLVVSKVANFSVDLPDANVAIQVSGTFGSRQEEAQRLGRILRPKISGGMATFYSLITKNSKDQTFSRKRQLFLTEQGYKYTIWEAETFFNSQEGM